MIECEGCQEWFHAICLSISKYEVQKIKKFLCPVCAKNRGIEYSFRIKPPSRKAKLNGPKLSEIETMLAQCPGNVVFSEKEELKSLMQRITAWISDFNLATAIAEEDSLSSEDSITAADEATEAPVAAAEEKAPADEVAEAPVTAVDE